MKNPKVLYSKVAILLFVSVLAVCLPGEAKKKKVQEVIFTGTEVEGQGKNPDGATVIQRRGVEFVPLYKVKKHFDDNIKESVEYL